MQTLSNSFALPGFKLSWLTFHGPDKAVQSIYKSVEYLADTFLTLNQLSQTLLPEIIKNSLKWRYKFAQQVEKNHRLASRLLRKVPNLKLHKPEGGFYCLLEASIKKTTDQELVIDLLKQTGVYLHPGQYYGLNPNSNYLILCFLQNPRVLTSSLKKVAKYFKKLPQKPAIGIKLNP
jgi:aspartate/methionine/tyrosine aminotransferase